MSVPASIIVEAMLQCDWAKGQREVPKRAKVAIRRGARAFDDAVPAKLVNGDDDVDAVPVKLCSLLGLAFERARIGLRERGRAVQEHSVR